MFEPWQLQLAQVVRGHGGHCKESLSLFTSGRMNHCATGLGRVLHFSMADGERKEPADKFPPLSLFSWTVPNHGAIR